MPAARALGTFAWPPRARHSPPQPPNPTGQVGCEGGPGLTPGAIPRWVRQGAAASHRLKGRLDCWVWSGSGQRGRGHEEARVVLVAVALLLIGLLPLLFPRSRITKEACDRIEEGMSQAEVEAILGGPPGDYRTVTADPDLTGWRLGSGRRRTVVSWLGDEGSIEAGFGRSGFLVTKEFDKSTPPNLGFLGQWRGRFSRWRERVFGAGPRGGRVGQASHGLQADPGGRQGPPAIRQG